MRLFTDVRIGKRMGIGFGITLSLMVVIVVTGIFSLRGIGLGLDQIVSVNAAKIRHAGDVRSALADVTYLIGEIVSSEDPVVREEAKSRIGEIRTRYKRSMEDLEKLEKNEEGKSLIAKLKAEVAKGREINTKTIDLGMAGDTKGAAQQYGELVRTLDAYIQAAEAVVRYNEGRLRFRYEEAKRSASTTLIVFVLLGVINLAIGIIFSVLTTRSIAIPIMHSSSHIDMMAKGDFSIPVSRAAVDRKDELGVFARSMDAMNTHLGETLKEVTSSVSRVASASVQLSASAENLSKGATEQVGRATQVATASTQMNQASEDIAKSSNTITESAGKTVNIARDGQGVVEKTIREVNVIAGTVNAASGFVRDLGAQSEKIGNIITVIEEIADQTNLLALNAAIEAARAGEQGRGFAVVADEVKKLAERTSSSTAEIGGMIKAIKGGVDMTIQSMEEAKTNVTTGVQFSSQAQAALQDIIESVDGLYGGVHQIATAIEEMSATTDEITRDINQISEVTKVSLTSAEEISGAAVELSQLATSLEGVVQRFKVV
jgi:methyl-accepting chemotaxis protein